MPNNTPLRAFLAHSKEDTDLALDIYHLLRLDGYSPWIDKKDLVPGHDWELEIKKAVRGSDVVIVFISEAGMDRHGYLHKELTLALDTAQEQPEGTIYIIPVRIGDCKVPERLAHLHWLTPIDLFGGSDKSFSSNNGAAEIYIALQASLRRRRLQLEKREKDQYGGIMYGASVGKSMPPFLRPGRYLVIGKNPEGTKYFGTAAVKKSGDRYSVTLNVEGTITSGHGEEPRQEEPLVIKGDYEVTFSERSLFTRICRCTWGAGGSEQFIPASPIGL
jgi:hypothetical protein